MNEKIEEKLDIKGDDRGIFVEIFKFANDGQISLATSKPGIMRGNHYHTKKIEKFCVIEGEGELHLKNRATKQERKYILSGKYPMVITILPEEVHDIVNTGNGEMKFLIWANEIFDPENPDTFREEENV